MISTTLQRETFRTSRLLDFCSERELTAQVGHERKDWPLVVLKELIDNALDACEEAGTAPQITIKLDKDGITVADNGPGIPETTIAALLDFAVRVSSREAYISPTRGAQGNALKTILAMPFVLDGERGRVDIASHGQQHEITFAVNRIRQEPVISRATRPADVKIGTAVKLWWPDSACSELHQAEARFLQLADDYTFVNPHLTVAIDWFGRRTTTTASDPGWVKWSSSSPTSPHWYGQEELERLLSAYIALDQDRGVDRYVRDVIDLGLRLADVRAYELESEPVQYGKRDPRPNLQDNDATREEIAFLCDAHGWRGHTGRRVELNAFTSRAFITWIEAKLQRHKIGKVIPDEAVLTTAYRRAAAIDYARKRLEKITKEATAWADTLKVPKGLPRTIRRRLKANPAQPWDRVIADLVGTDQNGTA